MLRNEFYIQLHIPVYIEINSLFSKTVQNSNASKLLQEGKVANVAAEILCKLAILTTPATLPSSFSFWQRHCIKQSMDLDVSYQFGHKLFNFKI